MPTEEPLALIFKVFFFSVAKKEGSFEITNIFYLE